MSELQIFENEQFGKIRVVEKDDAPWFIVKDVCEYFGVRSRTRFMQAIDDNEKGGTRITTPGGEQTVAIVSEAGLYDMLFALRPTEARGVSKEYIAKRVEKIRRFKRWVTSEVLPAIRRHGMYATDEVIEKILTNPDFGIRLLTELKREREQRVAAQAEAEQLTAKVEKDAPKVFFADEVATSKNSILVGQLAKLISQMVTAGDAPRGDGCQI